MGRCESRNHADAPETAPESPPPKTTAIADSQTGSTSTTAALVPLTSASVPGKSLSTSLSSGTALPTSSDDKVSNCFRTSSRRSPGPYASASKRYMSCREVAKQCLEDYKPQLDVLKLIKKDRCCHRWRKWDTLYARGYRCRTCKQTHVYQRLRCKSSSSDPAQFLFIGVGKSCSAVYFCPSTQEAIEFVFSTSCT